MKKKLIIYILSSFAAIIFLCFCCDDKPRDSDYYYQPSDNSFGKIIEGSIYHSGFSMETLVYPTIKDFEEYDDYVLARQEPNIKDYYKVTHIPHNHRDSITLHQADSINQLIDWLNKMPECYWIVQKSTKKVYGPLTKTEYDRLSKKLDVKNAVAGKHIRVYRLYL